jgi:DNA-binding transcriptional ArsR family regulator
MVTMAIRFELRDDNVRAVRFVTAPLAEATHALNALLFPGARPLQHEWIRSARDLPLALRREIRAFGFALDHALPDCVLPDPTRGTEVPFEEALAGIAALEPERAAYELTRPAFAYVLADVPAEPDAIRRADVQAQTIARARHYGRPAVELARLAVSEPATLRDRFVALLDGFWRAGFADVWGALGPQLARIARRDARRAATRGVYAVLDGRFEGIAVDRAAGWFERRSPHDHVVRPTRANPVVFVPSVFVWPHVRVNCDPPWPLAVLYPPADVRAETAVAAPHPDVERVLRALGDPTRLRILRALADRPRPTQELAPLVGLGEPGTSRHLHALAAAGLVRAVRDGRYVLYEPVPERLEHGLEALRDYVAESSSAATSPRSGRRGSASP